MERAIQGVASVEAAAAKASKANEIRKSASGFEALFLQEMMKHARAGLPGDELTGGQGVTAVQGLLDTELTRLAGTRAGFGLADAVARQFEPKVDGEVN